MFGPDKCGEDYKLHFIFRHKSPKTGKYEEKHAKRPDADLKNYFTDKKTHLYTLSKAMHIIYLLLSSQWGPKDIHSFLLSSIFIPITLWG